MIKACTHSQKNKRFPRECESIVPDICPKKKVNVDQQPSSKLSIG